ncbi:hypothetical protein BDQ17DRAFT_1435224 [Cyathus striatus]|nr:hypothetical protein BDQ17DRAFT_1435224 [Cyathus striatus]
MTFVRPADLSISVAALSKGQLIVKATAYGQNAEFKIKYEIVVINNSKAIFRLTSGCEKLKKILSANSDAVLNVESSMTDIDATSKLTREEFEALIQPVLDRIMPTTYRIVVDSRSGLHSGPFR